MLQWLVGAWGVGGVLLLLAQAVWRLTPLALEPWLEGLLQPWQAGIYVAWLALNAYAEGYRGFQRSFSPRVVARALHLAGTPGRPIVLVAPLHAMGLIAATPRRMLVSWMLVLAIVGVVIAVRAMPQPYRGIVDGGVVVGLLWGAASILFLYVQALRGRDIPVPLDLP